MKHLFHAFWHWKESDIDGVLVRHAQLCSEHCSIILGGHFGTIRQVTWFIDRRTSRDPIRDDLAKTYVVHVVADGVA